MDQSGFKFVERFREIKEFRYFKFLKTGLRFPFTRQTFLLPVSFSGNSNFDLESRRPLCAQPLFLRSQHLFQSIQKGILSPKGKTFKSASGELKFRGIWSIAKDIQLDGTIFLIKIFRYSFTNLCTRIQKRKEQDRNEKSAFREAN